MSPAEVGPGESAVARRTVSIGDITVTALRDSLVDFPFELMAGADLNELRDIHRARNLGPRLQITINAFLVQTGSQNLLIDTGIGGTATEFSAQLLAGLELLGVRPQDVTHVLLSHLHADHAGGAVREGETVFPAAAHLAHHAERTYWFGGSFPHRGEAIRQQYKFAQTLKPMLPTFHWLEEEQVLPGIELVHLPGHTPGHSGVRITSGADSLLIWGDTVHQPHFQLHNPTWGVAFDSDPAEAVRTRIGVLEEVSSSQQLIAGMHTDFPVFGTVRRRPTTGYDFVPLGGEAVTDTEGEP